MGTKHGFTTEELELLTEDERAAILDEETLEPEDVAGEDDTDADDKTAAADTKPEAAAADADADEPAAKADDKKPDEADAAQPEEPATPPAGQQPGDKQPPAAEEKPPLPKPAASPAPRYEVPADAKERMAAFDSQLDEIAQKFDDGEITATEMRQQSREIERERDQLKETVLKYTLSEDVRKANWSQRDVPAFLAAHPEYAPGSMRFDLLDTAVRKLQVEGGDPYDPDILAKAHEQIMAEFGDGASRSPAPSPGLSGGQKAPARQIPPTLAHVPASDISPDNDGGKYAHLDRLADTDPLAYEEAMARMSDAEREAYLATA